ncbi:MAG: hypothetical protein JWR77_1297 [Rhizorhabdus sp.]|nr:hypothetical protein [Rhizorhabdus sp.]
MKRGMKISAMAALALAMGAVSATPAAALVTVSVGAAGATSASVAGYNFAVDTLNNATNGLPSITFGTSGITGTSSDFVNIYNANVYGGAGGTGQFGTITGNTTIQLSQSVNYFGLWGSALDWNNTVELYNGNALLGSYALQNVLQSSPGYNASYLGNPFMAGTGDEQYAFFNFMSNAAFDRVKLVQNGGGGFEFDNLTVGTVSAAPEPATWAMLLIGFGAIGWLLRGQAGVPVRRRMAG